MLQFIETIAIKNREPLHLNYHQARVEQSFKKYFEATPFDLESVIKIPVEWPNDLSKWRLIYSHKPIQTSLQIYQPTLPKSFAIVETKENYDYKFKNRNWIQKAIKTAQTDEVIFSKNGKICDASYSNLIFQKEEEWFTPKSFLLNGTTRQRLLIENKIREADIYIEDLKNYHTFKRINALLSLENSDEIPIEKLI